MYIISLSSSLYIIYLLRRHIYHGSKRYQLRQYIITFIIVVYLFLRIECTPDRSLQVYPKGRNSVHSIFHIFKDSPFPLSFELSSSPRTFGGRSPIREIRRISNLTNGDDRRGEQSFSRCEVISLVYPKGRDNIHHKSYIAWHKWCTYNWIINNNIYLIIKELIC